MSLKIATFSVLTACFTVIWGGFIVFQNTQSLLKNWGDGLGLIVYVDSKMTTEETAQLQNHLSEISDVDKVEFVSQAQAIQDFKAQMSFLEQGAFNNLDWLKIIPASFQVSFKNLTGKDLASLSSELLRFPGITDISYGAHWIKTYVSALSIFQNISLAVGMLLFSASLLIISNMLRAQFQSRQQHIAILQLMGATQWMVRKPFLLQGASYAAASSLLSILLTTALTLGLKNQLIETAGFSILSQQIHLPSWDSILVYLVLCLVIGCLAAYLCIRKISLGTSL